MLFVFLYQQFYESSNSLKWNFHRTMNLFIVLWNWLNIRIPPIFSAHFFYSWFTYCKVLFRTGLRLSAKSLALSSMINRTRSWWSSGVLPFSSWSSKEWNGIRKLLGPDVLLIHFILVRNISIKNEWSCIKWSLEGTLSGPHGWAVFRAVLNTHCLNSFSCNWFLWSVLSKEFRICHCRIIECYVVVHWAIEIFSVGPMSVIIILWALHIKIRDPA